MKIDPTQAATIEPFLVHETHNLFVLGNQRYRQSVQKIENLIPIGYQAAGEFSDNEWMA